MMLPISVGLTGAIPGLLIPLGTSAPPAVAPRAQHTSLHWRKAEGTHAVTGPWGPQWCHPNPTFMCFPQPSQRHHPSMPSSPITILTGEEEKPGHTHAAEWCLDLSGHNPPESQLDHMAKWWCQWDGEGIMPRGL